MAPAEVERRPIFGSAELVEETVEQPAAIVVGGATLGTLLHKLMEEVLNGELEDGLEALVARASELWRNCPLHRPTRLATGYRLVSSRKDRAHLEHPRNRPAAAPARHGTHKNHHRLEE